MLLREIADRASVDELVFRTHTFKPEDVEIREDGPTGFSFEGIASVVDFAYPVRDIFGEYMETIKAGAFDATLRDKKATISLYKGHKGDPYAVRSANANTLTLSVDPHLRVKADLDPARSDVQNLASMLRRREMTEMSIGFRPITARDRWNKDYTAVERTQVSLREVSIVELGANLGGTEAAVRSLDEAMRSLDALDLTQDELTRAMRSFERRFADLYTDDVRARLRSALIERFQPGQAQYVWIRDFSDTEVIFEREGYPDSGCFRLDYTLDDSGSVMLADVTPKKVTPFTTYRSASDLFAERDRLDRDRHALKRPAPIQV